MNQQLVVNNFSAVFAADVLVGDLTANITVSKGALPALANGDYIILNATQPGAYSTETSWEGLKVTAWSGSLPNLSITFSRQEYGTAAAWPAGSKCDCRLPAATVNAATALIVDDKLKGPGFRLNKKRAVYAGVTQSTFTAGLTAIRTTYGKCEVDAIPLRARVCLRNRVGDVNLAHWDFAIAMTEVATDATDAEKFSPIVGGVEYNSLPPAGYPYGWITGNMAGGSAGTIHETTSDAQKITAACGPWVDLPFVPRADGKKGGIVLFRAVHNNTGSSFSVKNSNFTAGGTGADYKSRRFWTRASANGVNGITSLTSVPSSAVDDAGVVDIFLEFEFATPVRSVWVCGDSITANFEYTGWAMQAVWGVSSVERPVVPFLHALSGSSMQSFVDLLLGYSAVTGSAPTDLIIPCFSPNGVQTSDQTVLDAQATLSTVLNWAKANGVRVFFWDGCPNNSYTSVQQTRINAMRTWAKGQVASGNAYKFVEMARGITAIYGDASGEKYITGLYGDSTHPNQAGATRMSPLASSALMMN